MRHESISDYPIQESQARQNCGESQSMKEFHATHLSDAPRINVETLLNIATRVTA